MKTKAAFPLPRSPIFSVDPERRIAPRLASSGQALVFPAEAANLAAGVICHETVQAVKLHPLRPCRSGDGLHLPRAVVMDRPLLIA